MGSVHRLPGLNGVSSPTPVDLLYSSSTRPQPASFSPAPPPQSGRGAAPMKLLAEKGSTGGSRGIAAPTDLSASLSKLPSLPQGDPFGKKVRPLGV